MDKATERIYFDNAATTRVSDEVFEAMKPFFTAEYGNPSSIYSFARNSKHAVEKARESVAKVINADADEIFFTGSGTEADNWAIKGTAEKYSHKGNHIITTAIEHHAVLHTCEHLKRKGFEITCLPVDGNGLVRMDDLESAVRPTTILITAMFANNEIGTVQPVAEIGAFAREKGIIFHTDAVQAFGHVPIDVKEMDIDMLSLSAHKIYGPKGVGALYINRQKKPDILLHGGGQEKGRRAGTENVPGIVGLGKAADIACADMNEEAGRVMKLRDRIIDGVLDTVPYSRLNGDRDRRLPGNANFSFEFVEGESILLMLDLKGFCASSGSACTSGSLDPSHVLLAIGLPHEKAHGSLRISLGKYNTEEEADKLLGTLPGIIGRLRQMSPLYEEFCRP